MSPNAGGAYYPAGTNPPAPFPNDWLPAFRLAPLLVVVDPPATPAPAYYGETFKVPPGFNDPNGLGDVFLADQVSGEDLEPATLDTLPLGADDKFNYRGSFLSLVQTDFPSITDLSELTPRPCPAAAIRQILWPGCGEPNCIVCH